MRRTGRCDGSAEQSPSSGTIEDVEGRTRVKKVHSKHNSSVLMLSPNSSSSAKIRRFKPTRLKVNEYQVKISYFAKFAVDVCFPKPRVDLIRL